MITPGDRMAARKFVLRNMDKQNFGMNVVVQVPFESLVELTAAAQREALDAVKVTTERVPDESEDRGRMGFAEFREVGS